MPIRMTDYKPKCFTLVTQQHKQTSRTPETNYKLVLRKQNINATATAVALLQ